MLAKEVNVSKGISALVAKLQKKGFAEDKIVLTLVNAFSAELSKTDDSGGVFVPVGVFLDGRLGVLECLVKFLREELGWSFVRIGGVLGRRGGSVCSSYRAAVGKVSGRLVFGVSDFVVPVGVFRSDVLSGLECLVVELKRRYGLRNCEVARLLHRDDRTIWTVVSRAKKAGVKL